MRLRYNLVANFVGNALVALFSLLFVPIYVRMLGVESYGLIGFFATIQAIVSLLDLGIGSATNREIARLRAVPGAATKMRSLVRTLEVVYWTVGLLLVLVLGLIVSPIAQHWLRPDKLEYRAVVTALLLMAVSFGIRWPSTLYTGGLLGLERQVLLNAAKATTEVIRNCGALFVLCFVSPTLLAFLYWQIAAATIGTVALALLLWRSLPKAIEKPQFAVKELATIWRFAVGLTGVSLTVVVLTQLDKLLLVRLLPLTEYGYYVVATAVAGVPGFISGAVFAATFPRFSQLVASGDIGALECVFTRATQTLAVLVAPLGATLAVFSEVAILLWSRDPALALGVGPCLRILIVGSMLNAMVVVPYGLQLAFGWTRLAFVGNVVAVGFLVPLLLFLVPRFGALGAAYCWLLINLGYVFVSMQIMFRRLIPTQKRVWYLYASTLPVLMSFTVAGLFKVGAVHFGVRGYVGQLLVVSGAMLCAIGAATIALPESRATLLAALRRGRQYMSV